MSDYDDTVRPTGPHPLAGIGEGIGERTLPKPPPHSARRELEDDRDLFEVDPDFDPFRRSDNA